MGLKDWETEIVVYYCIAITLVYPDFVYPYISDISACATKVHCPICIALFYPVRLSYGRVTSSYKASPDFCISHREEENLHLQYAQTCLLYTSPSPRDRQKSRMPSSA